MRISNEKPAEDLSTTAQAGKERSAGSGIRLLAHDTVVYGLALAGNRLAGLLVLPFLTRHLTAKELGVIDIMLVGFAFLISLSTFGQDSSLARFYADGKNQQDRQSAIATALLLQLSFTLVVAIGGILAACNLDMFHPIGEREKLAVWLVIASLAPMTLARFSLNLLKWTFQRKRYVIVSLSGAACNIISVVAFVIWINGGVVGYFLAHLVTASLSAAVGLAACWSQLDLQWKGLPWWGMLCFGAPYACVAIAGLMFPALDRSAISVNLGLAAVGSYSIASKIGSVLSFATLAFQTAWGPIAFAEYSDSAAGQRYSRALLAFAMVGALSIVFLGFGAPLFMPMISAGMAKDGEIVAVIIGSGALVEGVAGVAGIGIDLSKRTGWAIVCYGVGIAVAAICVTSLVELLGIIGVAIGVLLGKTAQMMACMWIGHRLHPVAISVSRPLAALSIGAMGAVAAAYLGRMAGVMGSVTSGICALLAAGALWHVVLPAHEKSKVCRILRTRL